MNDLCLNTAHSLPAVQRVLHEALCETFDGDLRCFELTVPARSNRAAGPLELIAAEPIEWESPSHLTVREQSAQYLLAAGDKPDECFLIVWSDAEQSRGVGGWLATGDWRPALELRVVVQ